jgi:ribose 5-phosphate isomerase B
MVIYIGADHKGFELKEFLKKYLMGDAYEVEDVTPNFSDGDDYPDVAKLVALKVARNLEQSRGIVICGSGAGVDIAANKFRRIRSVLGFSPDQVFDARRDDNVNVLSLAADFVEHDTAKNMTKIFLETKFDEKEERFRRRLAKLLEIERENMGGG